jgi:hypothetical protein
VHWTYTEFAPESDLEQGDILAPTDELSRVLQSVHPHFCAPKYVSFVVSTQSCDLVRRPLPKTSYIALSAVRSLEDVLPRLLEQFIVPVARRVFRKSDRTRARDFLTRVFNQHEQAQGLFYLHTDTDVGLSENCVAFLRISVSLRAEHYEVLLRARCGRLASDFRAKYGWLFGNLYSRAASPDWADRDGGGKQLEALITRSLDSCTAHRAPIWLEDDLVVGGQNASVEFEDRDEAELRIELERTRPRVPMEKLANEVVLQAEKIFADDQPKLLILRNRLMNNGTLRKLVKKQA